jgi:hypothetical protein
MTIIFHASLSLLLGRLIHPWWLAIPVVFLAHLPSDLFCLFHPPGLQHPPMLWRIRAILLDEWQWKLDRPTMLFFAPGAWSDMSPTHNPIHWDDRWERRLLFWANVAIIVLIPFFTWLGWLTAMDWLYIAVGWMGFDKFWLLRWLFPTAYDRWIYKLNFHRAVDFFARLIWRFSKPILWRPGAWIEVGVSIAALTAALLI